MHASVAFQSCLCIHIKCWGEQGKGQWTQGLRELLGDKPEMRISVGAQPGTVTVEQVAKWTWQKHGQLWKVRPPAEQHLSAQRLLCDSPGAVEVMSSMASLGVWDQGCPGVMTPTSVHTYQHACARPCAPACYSQPANTAARACSSWLDAGPGLRRSM